MDIDWINQRNESFSLSGFISHPLACIPQLPLYWIGTSLNSSQGKADIDFHYYNVTFDNFTQSVLCFHGILTPPVCTDNAPLRQYFAGCGGNRMVLSTTLFKPFFTNNYTNATGYTVLNDAFAPVASYFLNNVNSANGFHSFCAHNLDIDYIGFLEDPVLGADRTTHSFIMPGYGMFSASPTSPYTFGDMRGGGIMAQTTALSGPGVAIVPPLMKSYRVFDGSPTNPTFRPTYFYDGAIDVLKNGDPAEWRDRHASCSDWRAIVVGEKRADNYNFGLMMKVDDQLDPIWLRVLEVTKVNVTIRLPNELNRVIPTYTPQGVKDGYFIVGTCYESVFPICKYLLYLKILEGCITKGSAAPLTVSFLSVIDFPRTNDLIEPKAVVQNNDGTFNILFSEIVANNNASLENYIITVGNTGVTTGIKKIVGNQTLNLHDFVRNPTDQYSVSEYNLVGKIHAADPSSGALLLRQTTDNTETCGMEVVPFTEVEVDYTITPRTVKVYTEQVEEVVVTPVVVQNVDEVVCSTEQTCVSTDTDDKMVLWNSHFDRGFGLTVMGDEVITTGLVAGPWRRQLENGNCRNDCIGLEQSVTLASERNIDCSFIITNRLYTEPNGRHGWYRVLIDPQDVIVSCFPSLVTNRGSSSLEVGYAVCTDPMNDNVVIAGMNMETMPVSLVADPCTNGYPDGLAGNVDGMLVSITNLGVTNEDVTAVLFGKQHDLTNTSQSPFYAIEKNHDQFGLDEPQIGFGGAIIWTNRPRAQAAEVFYDVDYMRDGDSKLIIAAGFSSTLYYNVQSEPSLNEAKIKRGLILGLSDFAGAESCGDVGTKWARLISSTSATDKSVSLSANAPLVVDARSTSYEEKAVFVGYSQFSGGINNPEKPSIWYGSRPIGSGILGIVSKQGIVERSARIALMRQNTCETANQPWHGLIRLFDVLCIDADQDEVSDGIAVVGSVMLAGNGTLVDDIDMRECLMIAMLNIDLSMRWYRIMRPVRGGQTSEGHFSRARSVTANEKQELVICGDANLIDVDNGVFSFPLVVKMTMDGAVVTAYNMSREPNICDINEPDDNPTERILWDSGETFMVGSSCDYKPIVAGTGCSPCVNNKGDILAWRWTCEDEYFGARAVGMDYVSRVRLSNSVGGTTLYHYERPVIQSLVATVHSDILLEVSNVPNICDFLHFPNVELAKKAYNVGCPSTSDLDNSWPAGTHKGKTTFDANCYP